MKNVILALNASKNFVNSVTKIDCLKDTVCLSSVENLIGFSMQNQIKILVILNSSEDDCISLIRLLKQVGSLKDVKFVVLNECHDDNERDILMSLRVDYIHDMDMERLSTLEIVLELLLTDNLVPIYKVQDNSVEADIAILLQEMGVSPNLAGYNYLKLAIKLILDNFTLINEVTSKLYPQISAYFNTNSKCVERAIRHGITRAWLKNNNNAIKECFAREHITDGKGPSNTMFMFSLAEIIRNRHSTEFYNPGKFNAGKSSSDTKKQSKKKPVEKAAVPAKPGGKKRGRKKVIKEVDKKDK